MRVEHRGSIEFCSEDSLRLARVYLKNSYAPYSNYRVSAVVRDNYGRFYPGVNLESSSYSLTMCTERVTLFNAI